MFIKWFFKYCLGVFRNDSTFELDGDYDTSEGIIKRMMVTFGNICIIFLMVMNLLIQNFMLLQREVIRILRALLLW